MNAWKCFAPLAALVLVGCNSGADDGIETADVSGTVTMGGQPLAGADVFFMADGGGFVGRGRTNDQGEYRLVQGAEVGPNTVFISKKTGEIPPEFQGDAESGMDAGQFEAMAIGSGTEDAAVELPEETIPPEYSDPEKSTLSWEVKEGDNEGVNFNL